MAHTNSFRIHVQQGLVTAAPTLTECIAVSKKIGRDVILAKNRDRAYKPDLEIVHTQIDGTEVAYLHDITTDWSEGLNEHGIGIINTALIVGYDEDEKKILKSGGKPSKDGARIRYALSKTTIEDVVKAVSSYRGGVKGHTIVASSDAVYTIEMTSQHKAHTVKHRPDVFLVRTNHGDEYPDAGYTKADEPEDYRSSVERRDSAITLLTDVTNVGEVLPALRTTMHDAHSALNVIRDTKKMSTTSQMLINVTQKTMIVDYLDDKVDTMKGVTNTLPKGYRPKITIQIHKIARKDVRPMKESLATRLLSTLRESISGGQMSNVAYEHWDEITEDAEYQGRHVTLNKPSRSSDGKHKFYVYVKNDKNNVIKLGFGDPNMEIKRDDPARRKAYRDRHDCANPGPKWKAEYWSCKMWADKPVSKIVEAASKNTTAKAEIIAVPKNPREGDGKGYWRIGNDVYRGPVKDVVLDVWGMPQDKRWESSVDHFARYWNGLYAAHYVKTKAW